MDTPFKTFYFSAETTLSFFFIDFGQLADPEKQPNRSFVGGPKGHFTDQEASQDEEQLGPIGQFERHGTPHPKPHTHAPKLKKQTIDGHIIHHDDEVKFFYL